MYMYGRVAHVLFQIFWRVQHAPTKENNGASKTIKKTAFASGLNLRKVYKL